jgi:DNA-binding winged helix-turn-helix (wHTH) protein
MERTMAIPAMNLHSSGAKLSFDGFELDEADARLTCEGQSVPLPPRPFAVLCALARRPGHLVAKGDLLDTVWGHRFVTDSVLKTAISKVRAALQDDPRQPRYIETVSRRGYRFIAAPIGASPPRAPAVERNVAAGREHPALTALTALCRGDAALADLIRAVAASLETERLVLNDSRVESVS